MFSSLDTSVSNVYNIMNQPGSAIKNVDTNKAMSIGSDLQQSVQEVQSSRDKGSNETFTQTLYKLNVLV